MTNQFHLKQQKICDSIPLNVKNPHKNNRCTEEPFKCACEDNYYKWNNQRSVK